MLSEDEVARSWRNLFQGADITGEIVGTAGDLLDELRLESPLRHRLSVELDELRKRVTEKVGD